MKTITGLYCLASTLASSYAWVEYGLSNALLVGTVAAGAACYFAIVVHAEGIK